MARQENAERGIARLRVHIDEAAGLLDDAVDRGQAEARALADFLGREERLEDLVDDVGRNAGAGVAHLDQHVVGARHALVGERAAFARRHVGGAHGELAAVRHGVARVDREIDDHLLELGEVRPSPATGRGRTPCVSVTFSPISRRSSMVRSLSVSLRSSTCGRSVCLREKASNCRTSAARAVGVLLDLDDVLERRDRSACAR